MYLTIFLGFVSQPLQKVWRQKIAKMIENVQYIIKG